MKITIEISNDALALLDRGARDAKTTRSAIVEKIILALLAQPLAPDSAGTLVIDHSIATETAPEEELDAMIPVEIAPVGAGVTMPLPDYGSLSSHIMDSAGATISSNESMSVTMLRLWHGDIMVAEEGIRLDSAEVEDAATRWAAALATKLDLSGTNTYEVEILTGKKERS